MNELLEIEYISDFMSDKYLEEYFDIVIDSFNKNRDVNEKFNKEQAS